MSDRRSKTPRPEPAERSQTLAWAYARREHLHWPGPKAASLTATLAGLLGRGEGTSERARIAAAAGVAALILGSGVAVSAMVGYQPIRKGLPALLQLSPTPAPAGTEPADGKGGRNDVGGTAPGDPGLPPAVAPQTSRTSAPPGTSPVSRVRDPSIRPTTPSTTKPPTTTPPDPPVTQPDPPVTDPGVTDPPVTTPDPPTPDPPTPDPPAGDPTTPAADTPATS
ncbi:hypothetical protein [Spirillospora sp. NPDC047279]|uniref:hypothetical protein n=1 Tax=Spirillospora sp. NPDC047279 TaxID=3155478 RepID=UPI0033D40C5A